MNQLPTLDILNNFDERSLLEHLHDERERARQHSFSEVSELVLHDLANPLSVVKFCVEQLEVNPELLLQKPQYLTKLRTNLDRAFAILDSFRTVIRTDHSVTTGRFDVCHRAAIRLIQNELKEFKQILTVDIESALEGISVKIPHFDLVYLLDTIYRHLMAFSAQDSLSPLHLKVDKEKIDGGVLSILVSCDQRGADQLTPSQEGFSEVTSTLQFRAIKQELINFGGAIEVSPTSTPSTTKAAIRIFLPLLQPEEEQGVNQ